MVRVDLETARCLSRLKTYIEYSPSSQGIGSQVIQISPPKQPTPVQHWKTRRESKKRKRDVT